MSELDLFRVREFPNEFFRDPNEFQMYIWTESELEPPQIGLAKAKVRSFKDR